MLLHAPTHLHAARLTHAPCTCHRHCRMYAGAWRSNCQRPCITFKRAFSGAFLAFPTNVECALVDVNGTLHDCIRAAGTERGAIRRLCREMDDLCARCRDLRLLILAVDGPAPFAKLREQRDRRAKPDADMLALAATPGTLFMLDVDDALRDWAASQRRGLVVIVDPSGNAGEGELKCFRHLAESRTKRTESDGEGVARNTTGKAMFVRDDRGQLVTVRPGQPMPVTVRSARAAPADETVAGATLVIGADSDLILLGLCSCDVLV
jgi:5'-3' exonuclease